MPGQRRRRHPSSLNESILACIERRVADAPPMSADDLTRLLSRYIAENDSMSERDQQRAVDYMSHMLNEESCGLIGLCLTFLERFPREGNYRCVIARIY